MNWVLKILALLALIGIQLFGLPLLNSWGLPIRLLNTVLYFVLFILVVNLVVMTIAFIYRKRKKMPPRKVDNFILGVQNFSYLIIAGGFFLNTLSYFGIDYITLFTSLSIVAAAIAIISKDYIVELVSGMIISFSKELTIDDYVKIGEHKGKVIDIKLTKTALLNDDDDIIFIPNNKVFSSEQVNYTRNEIKKVSIGFEMNILHIQTVEELEQDLIDTLTDYHEHIQKDSFNLKVVDIKKDFISLKFQYVLYQINRELERDIRKKTVRRVVNYVKSVQLQGA